MLNVNEYYLYTVILLAINSIIIHGYRLSILAYITELHQLAEYYKMVISQMKIDWFAM